MRLAAQGTMASGGGLLPRSPAPPCALSCPPSKMSPIPASGTPGTTSARCLPSPSCRCSAARRASRRGGRLRSGEGACFQGFPEVPACGCVACDLLGHAPDGRSEGARRRLRTGAGRCCGAASRAGDVIAADGSEPGPLPMHGWPLRGECGFGCGIWHFAAMYSASYSASYSAASVPSFVSRALMKSAGFGSDQWIAFGSHGAMRDVLFPWSAGCHHPALRLAISGCRRIRQRARHTRSG